MRGAIVRRIGFVVLALGLLLTYPRRTRGQECDSLQTAASVDLVSFLSSVTPDQNNGDCITWAIKKLGAQRYEPAIPVLSGLLSFKRPPTEREKQGVYLRMQTIWEIYPAAGALDLFGKKALPSLMTTIKAESTTALARENAVAVLMGIHKYEKAQGVALLKQEEISASDDSTKQRLQWAISHAIQKWCHPPDDGGCKEAANPQQSR
jgi:hypothetical protein